jgi:hypothetical protein
MTELQIYLLVAPLVLFHFVPDTWVTLFACEGMREVAMATSGATGREKCSQINEG